MLQVDDESTSVLMECMYHHLMDGRTTVAQALRLAMLHLFHRQVRPFGTLASHAHRTHVVVTLVATVARIFGHIFLTHVAHP